MFIVTPFCGAKSHQDFKFTHKQKRAYEMYTSYALLFSTEYVKIVRLFRSEIPYNLHHLFDHVRRHLSLITGAFPLACVNMFYQLIICFCRLETSVGKIRHAIFVTLCGTLATVTVAVITALLHGKAKTSKNGIWALCGITWFVMR